MQKRCVEVAQKETHKEFGHAVVYAIKVCSIQLSGNGVRMTRALATRPCQTCWTAYFVDTQIPQAMQNTFLLISFGLEDLGLSAPSHRQRRLLHLHILWFQCLAKTSGRF
jgi:hypothetical protein